MESLLHVLRSNASLESIIICLNYSYDFDAAFPQSRSEPAHPLHLEHLVLESTTCFDHVQLLSCMVFPPTTTVEILFDKRDRSSMETTHISRHSPSLQAILLSVGEVSLTITRNSSMWTQYTRTTMRSVVPEDVLTVSWNSYTDRNLALGELGLLSYPTMHRLRINTSSALSTTEEWAILLTLLPNVVDLVLDIAPSVLVGFLSMIQEEVGIDPHLTSRRILPQLKRLEIVYPLGSYMLGDLVECFSSPSWCIAPLAALKLCVVANDSSFSPDLRDRLYQLAAEVILCCEEENTSALDIRAQVEEAMYSPMSSQVHSDSV
ncbi:hypothetical protein WOLCODRAFT_154267 [Wolfiporia cocos MD-104 SS10]|uniref:Uncharacterized protein n=1 Tax=Wolfiporia cocos (strain MD-104) TaxID=742152 RepID=A0A2H3JZ97_WOLCO|nr:hypothetical protein WOLCODRAFT_154267 [Wolfiporia cocos MD-104 SS10]